jgi:hypothetical protein
MPKAPAFAGRWRIVEMDTWDNNFLDLVEEAHIAFHSGADARSCLAPLRASSTFATAPATGRRTQSSHGRASMRTIPLPVAGG